VDDTILARTPTALANPEGEMKACGGSQRFNCNEIQVSYETRGGSAMRYRKGASLGTPGLESPALPLRRNWPLPVSCWHIRHLPICAGLRNDLYPFDCR
jgi:hypothetical protein